jgi:hypothetical protein
MRNAWRSRSSLNGPQLAGCVTAMRSGGPPSTSLTRSTTQRSSRPISASAEYGVPPTMIGVGSPRRRLNSRATRSGSLAARRAAASPTSTVSSSRSSTTVGMACARLPSPTMS